VKSIPALVPIQKYPLRFIRQFFFKKPVLQLNSGRKMGGGILLLYLLIGYPDDDEIKSQILVSLVVLSCQITFACHGRKMKFITICILGIGIFACDAAGISSTAFTHISSIRKPLLTCNIRRAQLNLATSSSDLKHDNVDRSRKKKGKQYPKQSVVSRLKQAATRASANKLIADIEAKQREEKKVLEPRPTRLLSDEEEKNSRLASLRSLTAAIDAELNAARAGNNVMVSALQTRDSMSAIMAHNDRAEHSELSSAALRAVITGAPAIDTTARHHVAIVLSKPLKEDLVTIEYAARIQKLVQIMLCDDYQPSLICFIGGRHGNAHLWDCDAGYMYFRHLATSLRLSLDGIQFYLQRSSVQEGALDEVASHIQQNIFPTWIKSFKETPGANRRKRSKMHVEFSLFSSDYHLCILNDIHVRSPGQSPLQSLQSSKWQHSANQLLNHSSLQMKTSWRYRYATTAVLHSSPDPIENFSISCYHKAQELIPVLQNLRGIVSNQEFFQRDNYRVLVKTRRSLVSDMEKLYYHQPSLAAVHRVLLPSSSGEKKPMDVVLENALLSLGRCVDLVRAAGMFTGSVPAQDFVLARSVLEQAVTQITIACDPDKPLPPSEWGKLFQSTINEANTRADPNNSDPIPVLSSRALDTFHS
jgi:hypothetical protein